MDENELAEIESRILEHPIEARRDILRLMSELRSLKIGASAREPAHTASLYDAVTGVLNGGAYGVRFAGAIARATRNRKKFAVMSVDVALAANSPDSSATERALKVIAGRLELCVRAADTLARIDEEKFAIILEDLSQDGQVHQVTAKVQRALSEPVTLGERRIHAHASVGIRYYPSADNLAQLSPLDSRRH